MMMRPPFHKLFFRLDRTGHWPLGKGERIHIVVEAVLVVCSDRSAGAQSQRLPPDVGISLV